MLTYNWNQALMEDFIVGEVLDTSPFPSSLYPGSYQRFN